MPHLIVNIDGGSRGNPGPAATGVVMSTPDGIEILTRGEFIGDTTNNVAEYKALLSALRLAPQFLTKFPKPELEVRSDSELLVRQMTGVYRVKHPGLIPLAAEARTLAKVFGKVSYRHIRREENSRADKMANLAMDRRGIVDEID